MNSERGREFTEIHYSSKSDIACAMLREMIISGELEPSEPLRQRDLAERFGVSQTPIREALRRLESEGLVVNDPHRGATVAESRSGAVEDNAQIRGALESLGVRLAVRHITDEQLVQLEHLNAEMRALDEPDQRYSTLNRQFHFLVYESAASPMLLAMMRLLWQAMPNGPKVSRTHTESVAQHDDLIQALRLRDADAAEATIREHILGSEHLAIERSRTV